MLTILIIVLIIGVIVFLYFSFKPFTKNKKVITGGAIEDELEIIYTKSNPKV